MFKILVKFISLFTLLLMSMTFFTWLIGQLHFTNHKPAEKNLIANAQAETANITAYQPVISFNEPIAHPQLIAKNLTATKNKRIEFNFKGLETKLTADEKSTLIENLQSLNIISTQVVTVFAGPVPTENAIISPPLAKLRAQAIARIIYPYTQMIKMVYQPNLPQGVMMIEVSQTTK